MKQISRLSVATLVAFASAGSVACGGSKSDSKGSEVTGFQPPPLSPGFTRLVVPSIPDIQPGDDIMYCQYVMAPTDRDMDILSVGGVQSEWGHHIVAFATTANVPVGTSRLCQGDDNTQQGAFLGGVGGEGGTGNVLPPGVAFRLPKGNGIMLNTHFLNAGTVPIQGDGVLDIELAEVDPARKIAGFFVNVNIGFNLPPSQHTIVDNACTIGKDMDFFAFANHMHDFGTSTFTDLTRVGGAVEMVHDDPIWTYEMQFAAEYTKWGVEAPFRISKGDVLRTHCEWQNSSTDSLQFPREMCIGVGFFLSDGSPAPTCFNGTWIEGGFSGGGGGDAGTYVPGPACAEPGATGNELAVGKQCTKGGGECPSTAGICLADYTTGDWGNFCTALCSTDADCGTGAGCMGAGGTSTIKTCIPTSCMPTTSADGGTP